MNNTPVTTTWTPAEWAFLTFFQPNIEQCILSKVNIICIGISTKKQNDFSEWVNKEFKAKTFTDQDLNLVMLVSSIWKKSLNQTKKHLLDPFEYLDVTAIEAEGENRMKALRFEKELSSKRQSGYVFTLMQAKFLRI